MKNKIQTNLLYGGLSFLLPVLILGLAYFQIGVGLNQPYTILASDAYSQYSNFFAGFNNMLREGNSPFFTWYGSLGINNIAFMAYYLNGIFTPLALLFDNAQIADFVYYVTLLKFGCLGLSFWVYASRTFKIPPWQQLVMAQSYALMAYMLAYSEITMWFDGLIYLPLVILGINRILEERKPLLLFVAYMLVFVSNFYMAFMIGVFSFLYYCARTFIYPLQGKQNFLLYLGTSLLSGGVSMPIILPTILDISSNGEALSPIRQLLTRTTGPLDLIVKNLVGIYDSTKLHTIPFIYIGEWLLVFAVFFFVSRKIPKRMKWAYGLLLGFIFTSFYIEALDLLWQGLHTPNMFLFRYSFTFSFMVLMLAGYSLEQYKKEDAKTFSRIVLGLGSLFIGTYFLTKLFGEQYDYVYGQSLMATLVFLLLYFILWSLIEKRAFFPGLLVLLVSCELGLNSLILLRGIDHEWTYPPRERVTAGYQEIKTLVDYTKEKNENQFYRMENLQTGTINESMLYGYSGVNFFSSIRNRHSSQYLSNLGFHSVGTNLTIRYENNTLLMDSLLGVKYNLTSQKDALKFGYEAVKTVGDYTLYENQYALPLGFLTDNYIYQKGAVDSQVKLVNHLAQQEETFPMFTYEKTELIETTNVKVKEDKINQTKIQVLHPKDIDKEVTLTYKVQVPAKTQAYLTMYAVSSYNLPYQTIEINGTSYSSSLGYTGRYLSLGYHEEATEVTAKVKMNFYDIEEDEIEDLEVQVVQPDVALLDTEQFASTIERIQAQGIDIQVEGRQAQAELSLEEDRVLMTTIPYDKGWQAYIDGEKVTIPTFKDAFLAIPIPKGKHTLELVYFPYGMKLGLGIGSTSLLLFGGLMILSKRKQQKSLAKKAALAEEDKPDSTSKMRKQSGTQEISLPAKELSGSEKEEHSSNEEKPISKDQSLVTSFHFTEDTSFTFEADTTITQGKGADKEPSGSIKDHTVTGREK